MNSRRDFLMRCCQGVGGLALTQLLSRDGLLAAATTSGAESRMHHKPKAKNCIYIYLEGGPSQMDLYDPKPMLNKFAGSAAPRDIVNQIEFANQVGGLLPSPFKFARHGKSGIEVSELLPHLSECVDDMALIRSMYGEHFNHEPALYLIQSGRTLPGRPSLGSWVVYGLGSESDSLPGFVVLLQAGVRSGPAVYGNGFLPTAYQGTTFRAGKNPILNLNPPAGMKPEEQRDLLATLTVIHMDGLRVDRVGLRVHDTPDEPGDVA